MTDRTWIKSHASVLVKGFGESRILAPVRMKPEWYDVITNIAGPGEYLWWRPHDISKAQPGSNWGWVFEMADGQTTSKMRQSLIDWEIQLWFLDPQAAMLTKLSLPNPTSV